MFGKKRGIGGWLANPSLNAVMYLLTGDTVMSAIHLSKSKRKERKKKTEAENKTHTSPIAQILHDDLLFDPTRSRCVFQHAKPQKARKVNETLG